MEKRRYGLFTAITMIVGVVIGSGIFFKSDNILTATGGNIMLGVILFCVAALAIVFGSLCVSELASRTDQNGGIIEYTEKYCGKSFACATGWFHVLIYYPTLISVVSFVVGVYWCILFGIEATLATQVLIGLVCMLVLYAMNILSAKLGGYFQNASTVIKLLPLVLIAVAGLWFGKPSFEVLNQTHVQGANLGFLTAIGPIAYSFDGWIVSTSVCHEIKNSKRNLPLALIIAPIAILIIYVSYFVGVSTFLGPQTVMQLGDAHISVAAEQLIGSVGGKVLLVFVVISVLGTVNGLIMGSIRLPEALRQRNMLPAGKKLFGMNKNTDVPLGSCFFSLIVACVWMLIHYITQRYNLLPNSDISEISIAINYLVFIPLYYAVFRLKRTGEITSKVKGYLFPLLATLGSLFVLSGGVQSKLFIIYAFICGVAIVGGMLYWKRKGCKAMEQVK